MMVINEVICVSVSTVCRARILGRSSPGCQFNPRHDVNNTDMFIHGQNSLPFTLAGAFNFLGSSALPPLDSSLPHFLTVDSGVSVHQITPPHKSLSLLTLCFDTDRWNCYQRWLLSPSQPLSPTLHTVYPAFLFLIPYQVKNKSRERTSGKREAERLQPTCGPEPRVFLSDILSNVLSL